MLQQFVDREKELQFLERKYAEKTPQLIVIYGRRRIGKTELIKKFIEKKPSVYILCTRDTIGENIKEVKDKFYRLTGKEYFLDLKTDSFFDLFKYFVEEIGNRRVVIAVDEFPYLIELNPGIVSTFQKIWDELLKKSRVFLILCGSSVGVMETDVLAYESPLYGRRTGQWKVEPLRFREFMQIFGKLSIEEIVKLWAIFGGTPFYISQINPKLSVEENIKRNILTKGEILYSEPKILLREEFREPRIYMLILKYLSLGYNSHGKLSSATGIEKGNLSKYLSTLEETLLIEYILPLGQRRRGLYFIREPFFNFWFRFVYPNLSDLELGLTEDVYSRITREINAYYGKMFENLIAELMRSREIEIGQTFTRVAKWWHKDKEIDIVALNEKTKEILFGECKWQSKVNAGKVVKELAEKAGYVEWNKGKRKESYAVFAKSFSRKIEEFEGKRVYCIGLRELGKALRESKGIYF